jgi:hypothetical protein
LRVEYKSDAGGWYKLSEDLRSDSECKEHRLFPHMAAHDVTLIVNGVERRRRLHTRHVFTPLLPASGSIASATRNAQEKFGFVHL